MPDQTPFVPPSAPPPVLPPVSGTPSAPYGPPPLISPQTPAPKRSKGVKAAIIVAIVSGAELLVGGVVAGAIAATTFLTETLRDNVPVFDDYAGEDPLVSGDEASPVAVEPMECGGCFTEIYLESTLIDRKELVAVGLTETLEPWSPNTAHYDSEATWFKNSWHDAKGDPDECFVTYAAAPLSFLEPGVVHDDNSLISYTGSYSDSDEWSLLSQSVRLFEADQEAVDYMAVLSDSIDSCTHYQSGERDTYWQADVTPAPALNLPPSVAGIGWVELTDGYDRFYCVDLQRGNLVLRTGLYTYDEISEAEFRALIEHVAVQLAALAPTAP
jgi:hypothetical protein